jgi:hypothetical protein
MWSSVTGFWAIGVQDKLSKYSPLLSDCHPKHSLLCRDSRNSLQTRPNKIHIAKSLWLVAASIYHCSLEDEIEVLTVHKTSLHTLPIPHTTSKHSVWHVSMHSLWIRCRLSPRHNRWIMLTSFTRNECSIQSHTLHTPPLQKVTTAMQIVTCAWLLFVRGSTHIPFSV